MRKNGSRQLTIQQYRLTDLFLFAIILLVSDLLVYYAAKWFPDAAYYTLSFVVPISLTVMIRWGWYGVLFAALDGLIFCLVNGATGYTFLVYIVGNSFTALLLILIKLLGKKRITSKWQFTLLFTILGWVLVCLGRTTIASFFGNDFFATFSAVAGFGENGILSLFVGVLIVLVLRRFDGMWEDQRDYLKRLDEERKAKMRRDTFGDDPVEIDEETISILKKHDKDMF